MIKPTREDHPDGGADQDAIQTKESNRIAMYTAVSLVAFSIGVGIGLAFLPTAWHNNNRTGLIYCFTGIVVFAAIGVGAALLAQPDQPERTTTDKAPALQEIAIANQQRGYLQIAPSWIANGDELVAVRYRYKVDGLTAVTTENGFMRISIDEPSPDHTRTNPERFKKPIAVAVIDPKTTDVEYDISFPPLTAEQRDAWSNGKLVIFLTGEILYRDRFYPVTLKHRKYFGWRWNSGRGQYPHGFSLNPAVRNDEEDER